MRNLESMIAEFVDGLLQTIREATVEELRELLTAAPEQRPPAENSPAAPVLRAPPGRIGRATGVDRRMNVRAIDVSGALASVAEITDPESLLSLGSTPNVSPEAGPRPTQRAWWDSSPVLLEGPSRSSSRLTRSPRTEFAASESAPAPESAHDVEGECPASNVWPVGGSAPVRLSDNETLARVSNSGIV